MFGHSIKNEWKELKFDNIKINKKEFHKSKKPIDLFSVDLDKIVVSDKFKHNDEGFKYFIGNQKNLLVKPLCVILPQMNSHIKYFENGGKNMSFMIKDDKVWDKYEKIWDVIKNKLGINFHSKPVYEYKYLKAKVREYDGVIKANVLVNGMPKENTHYTCLACVMIGSVVRINKKNHPQIYLEECQYKRKKTRMPRFINTDLKSDSDSDSEAESENNTAN